MLAIFHRIHRAAKGKNQTPSRGRFTRNFHGARPFEEEDRRIEVMRQDPRVILVVDDDADVREAALAALAERGHDAVPAANGEEALVVADRLGRLDLLLTDIVMPGALDGFALARRLKQRRPETAILYTTAYVDLAERELGMVYGKVIPKPWRLRELQDEVERVLGVLPAEDAAYWRDKAAQFRAAAKLQGEPGAGVLSARAAEFEAMAERMKEPET
jgi:CheY-like chemotaxis protein